MGRGRSGPCALGAGWTDPSGAQRARLGVGHL